MPHSSSRSNVAPPDVLELSYLQAIIYLYRPSLMIPEPADAALVTLIKASSSYIKLSRRLHREDKIRLFWLAVYNLYAAGTAMLYCYSRSSLIRAQIPFRTIQSDVHACSALLWAIAERLPAAKEKRDAFDAIAASVMDSLPSESPADASSSLESLSPVGPICSRGSYTEQANIITPTMAADSLEHRAFPMELVTTYDEIDLTSNSVEWTASYIGDIEQPLGSYAFFS
jgi:hypothetical protein